MFEDEEPKRISAHEVGMALDAMGVEELQTRIGLLEEEIARLKAAIEARLKTRSEADSVFRL